MGLQGPLLDEVWHLGSTTSALREAMFPSVCLGGSLTKSDTVVINLVINEQKRSKGKPKYYGVPFVQLCQEVAI